MANTRVQVQTAAARMAERDPQLWASLLTHLADMASDEVEALMISPSDTMQKQQGRASMMRDVVDLLARAVDEVRKGENRK